MTLTSPLSASALDRRGYEASMPPAQARTSPSCRSCSFSTSAATSTAETVSARTSGVLRSNARPS